MSTFKEVQAIISKIGQIEKAKITPSTELANDLGLDSLDAVEIIMEVENKFNITIPDDFGSEHLKVKDIVVYVDKHTNK